MAGPRPDPELSRPSFRQVRQLFDDQRERHAQLRHLSMGMSEDLGIAIEEGATLIRVGSRLFAGCADVQ